MGHRLRTTPPWIGDSHMIVVAWYILLISIGIAILQGIRKD